MHVHAGLFAYSRGQLIRLYRVYYAHLQSKFMRLMGAGKGKKKGSGLFGGLPAKKSDTKPVVSESQGTQSTTMLNSLEQQFEESRMYQFGGGYGRQRVSELARSITSLSFLALRTSAP